MSRALTMLLRTTEEPLPIPTNPPFMDEDTMELRECFDYLTKVQCDLCFSKLRSVGLRCLPITTGRVYLDGCFVRVENYPFCAEAVADAVSAVRANVGHEGNGRVVDRRGRSYAMAKCWRTLNASGCSECLRNTSAAATGCLPWTEGRVANTGCFLRYSETDFLNKQHEYY
ncbi:Cysteine-rich receptor-like protein kinase 2 [Acorus calamus]|uniref:Cysteine-rich receptor-like protein kinase 2 n=1 Tax=Acorus calamus TaxID=4465 RepID=A0AAV9DPI2_ACOCL|nr:Cysteine-rich receptor-like protein kinase 2 [Acorus calamus]